MLSITTAFCGQGKQRASRSARAKRANEETKREQGPRRTKHRARQRREHLASGHRVVEFIQVVLGYLSSLEQLAVSDNTYKKVHDLQVHKEGLLTFVIANLFGMPSRARTPTHTSSKNLGITLEQ
jgi:hypothetical protein